MGKPVREGGAARELWSGQRCHIRVLRRLSHVLQVEKQGFEDAVGLMHRNIAVFVKAAPTLDIRGATVSDPVCCIAN
jgi:hypothetical protein